MDPYLKTYKGQDVGQGRRWYGFHWRSRWFFLTFVWETK